MASKDIKQRDQRHEIDGKAGQAGDDDRQPVGPSAPVGADPAADSTSENSTIMARRDGDPAVAPRDAHLGGGDGQNAAHAACLGQGRVLRLIWV
jgi:hypothetical protein